MSDVLTERLEHEVAREHVIVAPDLLARYERDWTGRWQGDSHCVVRPGSTAQVAGVVRVCSDLGVPLVVQGGNTGLVGGAVPMDGAVLLSTERLDTIGEVDATTGQVLVGAGATLADVRAVAAEAGWAVGVDIASRDSATIGGMVATDAGGSRVVAHGSMREQVLGLEVVLADGTVAQPWLEGLPEDVGGHDLRQVLVGSEGTLGVITRVLLQLVRPLPTTATMLLGTTPAEVGAAVAEVQRLVAASSARLTACEFMTAASCALVAEVLDTTVPSDAPIMLLVDLAEDVSDDLLMALDDVSTTDAVVGLDAATRQRLWEVREGHTEAVSTVGVPVKLDVAVPLAALGDFLTDCRATVATVVPAAICVLFGHAAEGNVHVNVVRVGPHVEPLERAVYELVTHVGGTISAEHGVGRAKVPHLDLTRDDGTLTTMRQLKDALDPAGILNPGVVLATEAR